MNNLTTFLANNYIWFLVVGIVLIFALIGYIVDSKNIVQEKPKTIKFQHDKKTKDSEPDKSKEPVKEKSTNEKPAEEVTPVNEKTEVLETVSLQDAVNKNNNADSIIKEDVKESSTFEK